MKVRELIAAMSGMDQDAEVWSYDRGAVRDAQYARAVSVEPEDDTVVIAVEQDASW